MLNRGAKLFLPSCQDFSVAIFTAVVVIYPDSKCLFFFSQRISSLPAGGRLQQLVLLPGQQQQHREHQLDRHHHAGAHQGQHTLSRRGQGESRATLHAEVGF